MLRRRRRTRARRRGRPRRSRRRRSPRAPTRSRANVGGAGFNQYADTRSQVYRGYLGETPSTDAAVTATRGEVVTYGGKVATTFFFSTSGGHTENIENVFTGARRSHG